MIDEEIEAVTDEDRALQATEGHDHLVAMAM
jgi:hypothetical protein